jgi:hypothetical protein
VQLSHAHEQVRITFRWRALVHESKRLVFGRRCLARSACAEVLASARAAKLVCRANNIPAPSCNGRLKGRRFAVYLPEELTPDVRRCLDNARALQELLYAAAPRYIKALKHDRVSKLQRDKRVERCREPYRLRSIEKVIGLVM